MVIHFCNVNDTHAIVQALPTQLRWQNQALSNPGIAKTQIASTVAVQPPSMQVL